MSKPVWQDEQTITAPVSEGDGTLGSVFRSQGRAYAAIAIKQFNLAALTDMTINLEASHDQIQWFKVVSPGNNAAVVITLSADINDVSPVAEDEGNLTTFVDAAGLAVAIPAPYWRVRVDFATSESPASTVTLVYSLVSYDL